MLPFLPGDPSETRESPPEGRGAGGAGPCLAVAMAAGGIVVLLTVALALGWPTVQRLDAWFWRFHDTPLSPGVWVPLVLGGAGLAWGATRLGSRRTGSAVLLLMALAVGAQHGLAFAEGRGLAGLRDRALLSGHAEFALVASRGLDPVRVISDYEALVHLPQTPYCRSKPPGQLLFYMGVDALAQEVVPADLQVRDPQPRVLDARHRQLVELLTWLLPVLAAAGVGATYLLARGLLAPAGSVEAAALVAVCPPLLLVTLHLDQALYPAFSAGMGALAVAGAAGRQPARAGVLMGGLTWCALFVSFSLLPAVLLAGIAALVARRPLPRGALVRSVGSAVATFAAVALGFSLVFGYDPLLRYQDALAHHAVWKGVPETATQVAYMGWVDAVEFLYWLGPALTVLLLVAAVPLSGGRVAAHNALAWGVLGVIFLLSLMGTAFGETARLWLFLVPWIAVAVAGTLRARWPRHARRLLIGLLATQATWTLLLKWRQDFW